MMDAVARSLIDPPLDRLAMRLEQWEVDANTVTVTGFVIGLAAAGAIALGFPLVGLLLLLINRVADGLDGAVARRHGVTDLGGYLDITLDFIVYSALAFSFALADPAANALASAFLVFSFMGTGSSFLAFAIMAAKRGLVTEARGKKSLYYLGGLTEGTETILFFVTVCIWPDEFPLAALIFGCLCWLTTIGRIGSAAATLR